MRIVRNLTRARWACDARVGNQVPHVESQDILQMKSLTIVTMTCGHLEQRYGVRVASGRMKGHVGEAANSQE